MLLKLIVFKMTRSSERSEPSDHGCCFIKGKHQSHKHSGAMISILSILSLDHKAKPPPGAESLISLVRHMRRPVHNNEGLHAWRPPPSGRRIMRERGCLTVAEAEPTQQSVGVFPSIPEE